SGDKRGSWSNKDALVLAAEAGVWEAFEFFAKRLKSHQTVPLSEALAEAAGAGGHPQIWERVCGSKILFPNAALLGAARGGHINYVGYCLEAGADGLDSAITQAVGVGDLEVAGQIARRFINLTEASTQAEALKFMRGPRYSKYIPKYIFLVKGEAGSRL